MSTSQNTADTIVYLLNTDAIQKTGNYCLALNGDMKREMLENQAENAKLFHDEQGVLRIDIELEHCCAAAFRDRKSVV